MHQLFSSFFRLCKNRGVQIVLVLSAYLFLAPLIPEDVHRLFYAISMLIKDLLLWILPITVGFFIAHTIASFDKKAHLFIFAIILFEICSNFFSVWYGFATGHMVAQYLPSLPIPEQLTVFTPLWQLPFAKPSFWSVDKGTLAGLGFGLLVALTNFMPLKQFVFRGKGVAEKILIKFFSPILPIFILGFVARIYKLNLFHSMTSHCAFLVGCLSLFLGIYLSFLFFVGSGFSKKFLKEVKNLLPAGAMAFTSSSSLTTMPWTIEATGKNLKNREFAKAVIPATINIQQVGDCTANAFFCFLLYTHFFHHVPDFSLWASFSLIFVLARFATAAIMGGVIFVMIPIYESYLSFNAEMIALMLALNVLFDPLITFCNVLGNGALCRIFERVWEKVLKLIGKKKEQAE